MIESFAKSFIKSWNSDSKYNFEIFKTPKPQEIVEQNELNKIKSGRIKLRPTLSLSLTTAGESIRIRPIVADIIKSYLP